MKKDEHLGSMLRQMDISSLLGRYEASNSGCMGGNLVGLCVWCLGLEEGGWRWSWSSNLGYTPRSYSWWLIINPIGT